MARRRRTFLVMTAAFVAAVIAYAGLTLPSAARRLSPSPPTTIYGAFHVHTNRSGGSGSVDDVAAAAAAASLQFVIVSDHGDATRAPEPPHYRRGVLVIDAVEVSTKSGHLVVLGLNAASPYPLGAEARDTVEDVHRMGGWTVIAHPDSPKEELNWTDPTARVDGLEWLNADSEWRDEGTTTLLLSVAHYLVRPAEAIASIFDRPTLPLRRWDALARQRAVVGLAGVDAHARIGIDEPNEQSQSTVLARPSYKDMFSTVVQAVELDQPLGHNASMDADTILNALRHGETYTVVTALAAPGRVSFAASDGDLTRTMGQSLETEQPVTLSASVSEPADATVALFQDGQEVDSGLGRATYIHDGRPATYRVEVRLPGHTVPWIMTNAIRVGVRQPEPPDEWPEFQVRLVRALDDHALWAVEQHDRSTGEAGVTEDGVGLAFHLAPGRADGQYAAVAYPLSGDDDFDTVTATVRASAPMRLSLQLRAPGAQGEDRWERSIYVDTAPRIVTLRLQDFEVVGPSMMPKPTAARVRSLMLVVDTWHTRPGTEGQTWISDVSLGALTGPLVLRSAR